jgi:hypothetical protein
MKTKFAVALLLSAAIPTGALAQTAGAETVSNITVNVPVEAPAPPIIAAVQQAVLPAMTDVTLRLSDQLTSADHRVGNNFPLTVVNDVAIDGHVVIPAGTRAVGQVTWRTGRGGFGKSGKMEVALRYIELNGTRIPIDGFHRQEGEGRTGATIGAVVAAGVIGGLVVRGRNARIPAGFEMVARTVDSIPVSFGAEIGSRADIAASYTPTAYATALGRRRDAEPESRPGRDSGGN